MRLCRASSMLHEQHLQQLLSCCPQLAVTTQTPPTTRPRCRGMHLMRAPHSQVCVWLEEKRHPERLPHLYCADVALMRCVRALWQFR